MASELANSSKSSAFYEFEELEVIEFNEDTLRELLEEPVEEVQDSYCMNESMEAQINHNIKMENSDSLEKIEPPGDSYNWLDAMDTTPDMPWNDLAPWYTDGCSEEMVIGTTEMREAIDSSQMYNVFQMDEVEYAGLWQDNY